MSRTPTTTTPNVPAADVTHTPEQVQMLKEYRQLVADRTASGLDTGGKKAPVTRRINALSVRMILSGLRGCETADQVAAGEGDFVYFIPPTAVKETTYVTTPRQLVELIASLRAMSADNSADASGRPYPPTVRHAADLQLAKELENAKTRGIDPDADPETL